MGARRLAGGGQIIARKNEDGRNEEKDITKKYKQTRSRHCSSSGLDEK
jgi:hypothetical protein